MRVLHTADWHLGRRIDQLEITEEHQEFLEWLIKKLDSERVDVLLIAGDVFDTGTPSNAALKQYYDFLWRVKTTVCHTVIITGGNHDSIATLNAPQELLKQLNIYVVGGATEPIDDEIVLVYAGGKPAMVVCAVPFLRDRDVKLSMPGETTTERENRIKKGIADHYAELAVRTEKYKADSLPVIAMGHLYAAGARASDSEREIHAGSLGQVGSEDFPTLYDYVALGHLHRPQLVNKLNHIRYAGAPVALGFSEANTPKMVLIADFDGGVLQQVTDVEVPIWRQIVKIKGSAEEVIMRLQGLEIDVARLGAWVEIVVVVDKARPELYEQIDAIVKKRNDIERHVLRQVITGRSDVCEDDPVQQSLSLTDQLPIDIFARLCTEQFGDADEAIALLTATFQEALEKMRQADHA